MIYIQCIEFHVYILDFYVFDLVVLNLTLYLLFALLRRYATWPLIRENMRALGRAAQDVNRLHLKVARPTDICRIEDGVTNRI